jgi:hypothetical protein
MSALQRALRLFMQGLAPAEGCLVVSPRPHRKIQRTKRASTGP